MKKKKEHPGTGANIKIYCIICGELNWIFQQKLQKNYERARCENNGVEIKMLDLASPSCLDKYSEAPKMERSVWQTERKSVRLSNVRAVRFVLFHMVASLDRFIYKKIMTPFIIKRSSLN